ncbi:MAG TPA: aldolase/citrate lyase family protein [Terriglobia bacterium]|nr:aldolase/citrate lyase family protein [Terriglobia bacterium]
MIASRVLAKLRAGDFVRVAAISRVIDPWLTELVGKFGFDLVWLDMEHRPFGYDAIGGISLACRATKMDLMVRILKTGYTSPMRALEFGANGIMVPHCRSVEEARQWVEWTRFPPLGKRGFDGAGVDADYMLADPLEYLEHSNKETFLALQIEDREAVECVEEIAGLEGVDLLFVGPADLTISYGVPMQFGHPTVQGAIDRVAAAAAKSGKWWGIPAGTPEAAQSALERGARMVVCGVDHVFLVRGFENAFKEFGRLTLSQTNGTSRLLGSEL